MDKDTLYTEQEKSDFDYIRSRRLEMVEAAFDNDVPTRDKDVMAINQVLSSMEAAINNKAINRLKLEETASKDALLDIVAETLKAVNTNKNMAIDLTRDIDLDSKYTEIDTVPGETDINPGRLELEDFTNNGGKDND